MIIYGKKEDVVEEITQLIEDGRQVLIEPTLDNNLKVKIDNWRNDTKGYCN